MKIQILKNGKLLRFKIFSINFKLSKRTSPTIPAQKKIFLMQFNKVENGNSNLFVRVLCKYSLSVNGIKINNENRYFFGNTEATGFKFFKR